MFFMFSCGNSDFKIFTNPADKVKEKQPKKIDSTYSGEYKYFRDGDVLKSTVSYVKGIKHGPSKQYYADGKVMLEIPYKNGIKQGDSKKYYKSGKLYRVVPYHNGVINGEVKKYYEDGKVQAIIPYKKGMQIDSPKEFNQIEKPYKSKPEMHFKIINNGSTSNRFILEISIDNANKHTEYYISKLPEGALPSGFNKINNALEDYLVNELDYIAIPLKNGKAKLEILATEGYKIKSQVDFIALYKTRLRNNAFVKKSYYFNINK